MICDSTNALREGRSPSELDVARSLGEHHQGRQAARRRHHLRLQRRAHQGRRGCRQGAGPAGRGGGAGHASHHRRGHRDRLPAARFQVSRPGALLLPGAATRWCCCAPAARASRARRWPASPTTSIPTSSSTRAISSFSPRAPSPATSGRSGASRTGWSISAASIVTDGDALVHVTGHPRREELKEMYAWVRPRIAIPMHGEARHLCRARQARARRGRRGGARRPQRRHGAPGARARPRSIDEAPVGRLFRDGHLLVPSDDGPVRERRTLAFAGIVVVALARSGRGEIWPSRDRARRRADRGRQRAADARHRARRGRGHARAASRATGAGTARWCARRCGGPCARRWRMPGASGRSPRCCSRKRPGDPSDRPGAQCDCPSVPMR